MLDDYVAQKTGITALLNKFKANLDYLHAPNYAEYHHPGTGSDYTTVSSIGDDIDSTNFKLTITTYGDPALVMACFHGSFAIATTSSLRVNIVLADDNLSYAGRNLYYGYALETSEPRNGLGWLQFFVLPPGQHIFKAIWGAYGGDTAALYVASRPYFSVQEI